MPLQIVRQDITKMKVDAIVNTTNRHMIGHSGVDLAVHTAAGEELDFYCAQVAPLGLGMAKITPGFNLDAKYIIHTSGPIWKGGLRAESIILRSCYIESLKLAVEYGCESVAFPLISSGAYGYPKDQVLRQAVEIISEFLLDFELTVYICVFDRTSYEFSRELLWEISAFLQRDSAVHQKSSSVFEEVCYESAPLASWEECNAPIPCICEAAPVPKEKQGVVQEVSLDEYMRSMDKPFAYKLFELIDKSGMTDVECYKKANVDKKTFSKIKCNPDTYKPSKQTAVAFAIALRLSLDEAQELLATAGLTLSPSFTFDNIIRYFIQKGIYDIFVINEALFEFDQVLLGC